MKSRLLLLHGALGSKNQFDELKEILQQNFEVFAMNFEGHGGLPVENKFSIDLFSNNVLAFLKENNLEKIDVFGYSMGGYVAMNLAVNHPTLISKIITLGTKFNWTSEGVEKEVQLLNPGIIEVKVPKFAHQLAEIHSDDNWKIVMQRTADMMYGLGNGKKIQLHQLEKVKQDVLITVGGKDVMVTIEESESVAEVLVNGELLVIDEFQHPIEKVDKQKLASIIYNFING